MASVVIIIEDNKNGSDVDIQTYSDPPLPEDWEKATMAQKIMSDVVEQVRPREFDIFKYYH